MIDLSMSVRLLRYFAHALLTRASLLDVKGLRSQVKVKVWRLNEDIKTT